MTRQSTAADIALDAILAVVSDAVLVTGPDGRIVAANDEAEGLLGYACEDLVGRSVDELVPPERRGVHAAHRAAFHEAPSRRRMGTGMSLGVVAADGTEIPVDIALAPVSIAGERHVAAFLHDLRQPEMTNRELNDLNEQLRASVAFQQRFTSMISHELRTPLTLVMGLAEMLISRWDELDHDQALPYLHGLSNAAARQKLLLDDLLDVSRILEGKVSDVPTESVTVRSVVDDALTLLPALADDVVVDVEGDQTWRCDPLRASQVVVNLLTNARKYGKPPYVISAREARDRMELRVRDHGKGVPAHFEQSLFNRFSQADQTRLADGVGLGLHIVQWLLSVQDGRLWHERPDEGEGAVFVVSLPAG